MWNETPFENLIVKFPQELLEEKWKIVGQQRQLGKFITDLICKDEQGNRHILELKSPEAHPDAVDQVLRYKKEYLRHYPEKKVTPWIVAQKITGKCQNYADSKEVKYKIIPQDKCELILAKYNIRMSEISKKSKNESVFYGGGSQKKTMFNNEEAYNSISKELALFLKNLVDAKKIELINQKMQTMIYYRGIKLGGVYRDGNIAYLAKGILFRQKDEQDFILWGFKEKTHKNGHTWLQISSKKTNPIKNAFERIFNLIDEEF